MCSNACQRRVILKWLLLLVALPVLLITGVYQWENLSGARKLAEAKSPLLNRLGTFDPLRFAPPPIPDEQNLFAIPAIARWEVHSRAGDQERIEYTIPANSFAPDGFVRPGIIRDRDDGISLIDFDRWAAASGFQGPLPASAMCGCGRRHREYRA